MQAGRDELHPKRGRLAQVPAQHGRLEDGVKPGPGRGRYVARQLDQVDDRSCVLVERLADKLVARVEVVLQRANRHARLASHIAKPHRVGPLGGDEIQGDVEDGLLAPGELAGV